MGGPLTWAKAALPRLITSSLPSAEISLPSLPTTCIRVNMVDRVRVANKLKGMQMML